MEDWEEDKSLCNPISALFTDARELNNVCAQYVKQMKLGKAITGSSVLVHCYYWHLDVPSNKQTQTDWGSDKLVKCDWSCVVLLVGGLPYFLSLSLPVYQVIHYQYVSASLQHWLGFSPASIVQRQLLSADHFQISVSGVCVYLPAL